MSDHHCARCCPHHHPRTVGYQRVAALLQVLAALTIAAIVALVLAGLVVGIVVS